MSWNIEAFLLCFYFYQNLWVVPHGTKGTGPESVTRPVYLRSQLRNNTNTVSTLVLLIHLLHVLCTRYAGIAHHRALQTSGWGWADSKAVHRMECSGARSLYWRSLSAGAAAWSVPYCQYREVCSPTRPNAKQANKLSTKNRPQVLCPGGIYSWWHSASSANGSRSHDSAPVTWAYGIPCPAMVSPNASLAQWGQAVVPGWSPYMVLESGFRPAQMECWPTCHFLPRKVDSPWPVLTD